MAQLRVVALIPAYNEEASIGPTIEAMLAQERVPDQIVVIPNGCTDGTAEVARRYPVTVLELPRLEHKKSEALNIGWSRHARDADVVICLDADTVMPPNAVRDWEQEFQADAARAVLPVAARTARAGGRRDNGRSGSDFATGHEAPLRSEGADGRAGRSRRVKVRDRPLAGSSSKFTMLGTDFLTRLQRAEFARWTDTALRRGWTSVLAGTGAAISGQALREVASRPDREGPWAYTSQVEDFELTYRIRELGYRCQVSPTVRAYTDSMKTVKALWGQRMKWQVGTIEDLLRIGLNRLTVLDWWQQFMGLYASAARALWVGVILALCLVGQLHFQWLWWVAIPVFFMAVELRSAVRIPHRDKWDLIFAVLIVPSEVFAWLRAAWFVAAWVEVPLGLLRGRRKDRWSLQYKAEAFRRGLLGRARRFVVQAVTAVAVLVVGVLSVGNLSPTSGFPSLAQVMKVGPGEVLNHSTPATCTGYVALTYDDGPTEVSEALSDSLARYGLHAVFFLTGEHIQQNPDAVRALVADGHQIGNHTMTHPHLPTLPADTSYGWQDEISDTDDLIESITGQAPTLFRPPYGETNANIRKFAESQGMAEAMWTVDTNDWSGKTAAQVDDVVAAAKPGDIILMHDDEITDVATVPLVAATLRHLGLCTGQIALDKTNHHVDLLDMDENVKVIPWEGK